MFCGVRLVHNVCLYLVIISTQCVMFRLVHVLEIVVYFDISPFVWSSGFLLLQLEFPIFYRNSAHFWYHWWCTWSSHLKCYNVPWIFRVPQHSYSYGHWYRLLIQRFSRQSCVCPGSNMVLLGWSHHTRKSTVGTTILSSGIECPFHGSFPVNLQSEPKNRVFAFSTWRL